MAASSAGAELGWRNPSSVIRPILFRLEKWPTPSTASYNINNDEQLLMTRIFYHKRNRCGTALSAISGIDTTLCSALSVARGS
jgi:hypothetical protein